MKLLDFLTQRTSTSCLMPHRRANLRTSLNLQYFSSSGGMAQIAYVQQIELDLLQQTLHDVLSLYLTFVEKSLPSVVQRMEVITKNNEKGINIIYFYAVVNEIWNCLKAFISETKVI
jgi:hypothetical protein